MYSVVSNIGEPMPANYGNQLSNNSGPETLVSLTELQRLLSILEDKLAPVLLPMPLDSKDGTPMPSQSPVMAEITYLGKRLQSILNRVQI